MQLNLPTFPTLSHHVHSHRKVSAVLISHAQPRKFEKHEESVLSQLNLGSATFHFTTQSESMGCKKIYKNLLNQQNEGEDSSQMLNCPVLSQESMSWDTDSNLEHWLLNVFCFLQHLKLEFVPVLKLFVLYNTCKNCKHLYVLSIKLERLPYKRLKISKVLKPFLKWTSYFTCTSKPN